MINRPGQQRIVITGFMGAGKTTVAVALAQRLGCSSADLDELVTAREGRTPQELIDEAGEAAFREAETRALVEVLSEGEARVIALGGGAFARQRNRAALAAAGCLTVWLDAPFELCWRRIQKENSARPLGRDLESARRLYQQRLASYRLAALSIRVGATQSASDIAAAIIAAALAAGAPPDTAP